MEDFAKWWLANKSKTRKERLKNYNSLKRYQQTCLRRSFVSDGWCELFCQNHIDRCLNYIKSKYSIDLFDLRIKVLKFNRIFLIERYIWEKIEHMILEYEPLYNSDILFGGLKAEPWGKEKQFIRIASRKSLGL